MELSGNHLIKIGSGASAKIYTIPDTDKIIKIIEPFFVEDMRYIDDIGQNTYFLGDFDDHNKGCNPIILQESFFSSIDDPRIVGNRIGKYNGQYCLISNFAGVSLSSLNNNEFIKSKNFDISIVFTFFAYHIIMAVGKIEKHGVAHRDYHIGNFMCNVSDKINEDFYKNVIINDNNKRIDYIRVIDFGLAKFIDSTALERDIESLSRCIITLKYIFYEYDDKFNPMVNDFINFIIRDKRPTVSEMIEHQIFDSLRKRYNEDYDFAVNVKYESLDIILDKQNKEIINQYFRYMEEKLKKFSKWCIPLAEEIFLNYISINGIESENNSLVFSVVSLFMAMKITVTLYMGETDNIVDIDNPEDHPNRFQVINQIMLSLENFGIKITKDDICKVENNFIKAIRFEKILKNVVSLII